VTTVVIAIIRWQLKKTRRPAPPTSVEGPSPDDIRSVVKQNIRSRNGYI
jgi:hypothetical protein